MQFRCSRLLNLYLHLRSLVGTLPAGSVFRLENFLPEELFEEALRVVSLRVQHSVHSA